VRGEHPVLEALDLGQPFALDLVEAAQVSR